MRRSLKMHAAHSAAAHGQRAVNLADGTPPEQGGESSGAKHAFKVSAFVADRFPMDDGKPLQRRLEDVESIAQRNGEL